MTSILCANCELPISLGESFTQALEAHLQLLFTDALFCQNPAKPAIKMPSGGGVQ